MSKKTILLAVLFLVICGGLLYFILYGGTNSADEQPQASVSEVDSSQTTTQALVSQDSLSSFNEALSSAGLTDKVEPEVTVMAPNNEAFKNLPEGDVIKETLNEDITSYHLVKGVFKSSELTNNQKLPTVNGQDLVVIIDDDQLYIVDAKGNKAKILTADLETSNGVIHEIDRVLLTQ